MKYIIISILILIGVSSYYEVKASDLEVNSQTNQRLDKLQQLLEEELISNEEYEIKRKEILDNNEDFYSKNIKDFGCFKNYTNKLNGKNIPKTICFCMQDIKYYVYYQILTNNYSDQINYCTNNQKKISYGYFLENGGYEFHNKNSIVVGPNIIISKEQIEIWKNKKNKLNERKKIDREIFKFERRRVGCVRDRNNNLDCFN